MKQLKSFNEGVQERYKHKGRTYSIVDVTKIGGNSDTSHVINELVKHSYFPFIYELADTTDGKIIIVGRYTDIEKAKDEILMRGQV